MTMAMVRQEIIQAYTIPQMHNQTPGTNHITTLQKLFMKARELRNFHRNTT